MINTRYYYSFMECERSFHRLSGLLISSDRDEYSLYNISLLRICRGTSCYEDTSYDCIPCKKATMKYSVLMPTYNERENVGLAVALIYKVFKEECAEHDFEIIIVDDNSPDGTRDMIRELQKVPELTTHLKLVSRPGKLGLGSAYVAGLGHASGEFVLLMDADLSHHPKYIPEFIRLQKETGCDIVTGTRYASGGGVAGWSLARKLTSRGANLLASFTLRAKVSDLTGAFRLYKKPCLQKLLEATTSKGYAFQMEVIVRAQYMGYSIQEVPIIFVDRLFGESKLGPSEFMLFLQGLARLFSST